MTVCVAPAGRTASRGDAATRLLVATIDGVWELTRASRDAPWVRGAQTLAGSHIGSLVRLADGKTIFAGAHTGGLFASTDDGRTWSPAMNGIAEDHRHIFTLYARENSGNTALFAGTQPPALYRSDDLGRTWLESPALRGVGGQDQWSFPAPPHLPHVKHISSHPAEPATLYVCIEQGALLRSFDDGASWHEITSYEAPDDFWYRDMHRIIYTADPREIYLSGGEGFYRSRDAGETWDHLTTRHDVVGYPDAVFLDPADERTIYLSGSHKSPDAWTSDPDVSTHSGFLRSRDGGASWEALREGLPERVGGTFEALAMHAAPGGPSFFAGTCGGEVFTSEDGGERWTCAMNGLPPISKVGHYKKFPAVSAAR